MGPKGKIKTKFQKQSEQNLSGMNKCSCIAAVDSQKVMGNNTLLKFQRLEALLSAVTHFFKKWVTKWVTRVFVEISVYIYTFLLNSSKKMGNIESIEISTFIGICYPFLTKFPNLLYSFYGFFNIFCMTKISKKL